VIGKEDGMATESEFPQVDRRRNLSNREFKREYQMAGRPVVIENATEGWKAASSWTFEFLKSRYGDTPVETYHFANGGYSPDRVELMPLGGFIDKILAADWKTFPCYVRDDWKLFIKHQELLADYRIPEYFFDWFKFLPSFMRLIYPRIFIGPKGAVTPLHDDIWGTHAWLAQLVGKKRWFLFPPDQKELLHDYKVCPEEPDLGRFPLYRKARPLEAVIGPGDIIFVPGGWPHYVVSLDPTISITHNFMGPGCLGTTLSSSLDERILRRMKKVLSN
jgi:hypothetical protein